MRVTLVLSGLMAMLAPPLVAQPSPVTLKGAPGRWTLNGQSVPDKVLAVRLVSIFEPRRDKRLYFATGAGIPYGRVVETMGTAWAAGVEELALLSDDGGVQDAVVVSDLVALPGLDADLRLPVSEGWGSSRPAKEVEITLRARGVEPTGLTGAVRGEPVLLRADAGLAYGDILSALRQAKARGARALSLAVQKPNGPGELRRRCEAGQAEDCGLLGQMYLYGLRDVPKLPATGVSLLRQACGGGARESCEVLAAALWEGESVQGNRPEAAKLLADNCLAGHKSSCELLKSLSIPVPKAPW